MALAPTAQSNLDKVRQILEGGARTGVLVSPPPADQPSPSPVADQTAPPSPISGAPAELAQSAGAPLSPEANLAKVQSILTGGLQPSQDAAAGITQASNLERVRAILRGSLDQPTELDEPNIIQKGLGLASQFIDDVIGGIGLIAPTQGSKTDIFFESIAGALESLVAAAPFQTKLSPVERAPGPARGERFAAVGSGLVRNIGARLGGLGVGGPVGFVSGGAAQEFSEIVRERKIDAIKRGDDPDDTFSILRDVVGSPGALGRVGVIAGLDTIGLGIATKLAQVSIKAAAPTAVGGIKGFVQGQFGTTLRELGGNAAVDIVDGLTSAATIALERGEIEFSDLGDADTWAGLAPAAIFQMVLGGSTQLGIGLRQRGIAKRGEVKPTTTAAEVEPTIREPAPVMDEPNTVGDPTEGCH